MRIGILCVGNPDPQVIKRVQENLGMIFHDATIIQMSEVLPTPEEAFDEERQQYRSDTILAKIRSCAEKQEAPDRVLGIADVDIFVPPLSFVFGEAERPGRAALISLWRLKPEFYKRNPSVEVLVERTTKEAVHELGHTFGLSHCSNPFCVMYFSNSIFETDRKQSLFCNKCFMKIDESTSRQG